MNCQETTELLTAYLHDEVTPSERAMTQAHIAECERCRQELGLISALEDRITQSIHNQVGGLEPAGDAWPRLQSALAAQARPTFWTRIAGRRGDAPDAKTKTPANETAATRRVIMKRLSYAFLLFVALFLGTVSLVPAARAQMQALIIDWFSFGVPGTESHAGFGNFEAFTPYAPTYLPAGYDLQLQGTSTAWPDYEALELAYSRRDWQFAKLIQSNWPALTDLPPGREVSINGRPGSYYADLSSLEGIMIPYLGDGQALLSVYTNGLDVRQIESFSPAGASLLIWFIDDIKYELLSNGLSKAELMLIAESLAPMESSRGELPPFRSDGTE